MPRTHARVRLDLGIGEAHHVAKAIDAYIKSGVYGSSLSSWREIRDKVRNALHRAALESEYGGGGYRGNPGKHVHAERVKMALKRSTGALDQAKAAMKSGKIERGTVRAMEAYAHAINTMRELEDAGVKKVGARWERAIEVGRHAADIVRRTARLAQRQAGAPKPARAAARTSAQAKAKPHKPPAKRKLTRAETRRRMMEENPSKAAAAKVKREISRI